MAIPHFLLLTIFAMAGVSSTMIQKRGIPDSGFGYNSIHDFGHYTSFKLPLPPAYSTDISKKLRAHVKALKRIYRQIFDTDENTISFLQSHHSKPVSYSGFTNHGRGHHDPGYSIEYRSEGFLPPHHGSHHNNYY